MAFKHSRYVSIEITSTLVKVAQASASGSIEKLVKRSFDKDAVDVAVKSALHGIPLVHAGIICVIPGEVATTKNLEVPSVDDEEIESILSLQAARYTPFNKDEILTGYIKIGSPRPNFTRVLLVIVKREIVKDRIAILKRAGLDVNAVLFVPEAVVWFYAKTLNTKKTNAPVVLIDVGSQSTNLIVHTQSTILMARNIPTGTEQLSADAGAIGQLTSEIKASVDTYEQEGIGLKPGRFILTTNHPALVGLDAALGTAFEATVEVIPYGQLVKGSRGISQIIAGEFADDSALDVIAPALTAAKCQANLIPQELKDQRTIAEKGRETLKTGILILATLLFAGGALLSKVYFKDAFLKQNLIDKYAEQRKDVQGLENMILKTRLLRQYLGTRELPLEAIRELYRLIPPEIYLSNISFDEKGGVTLQGVSDSMSQVFSFVTALENSDLFDSVKTKSTAAKKERGKDVASFEIVMKLTALGNATSTKDSPTAFPVSQGQTPQQGQ